MRGQAAALALALGSVPAVAGLTVQRVAVLAFETSHIGASGLAASDLFSASLVSSFPGVAVVERTRLERVLTEQNLQIHGGIVEKETAARLQSILGVDSIVIGSIVAMDRDGEGSGALMMTARLVDTSSGRILWAETITARLRPPWPRRLLHWLFDARTESDALVANGLLKLAAFELVQALGRHLQPEALRPGLSSAAPDVAAGDALAEEPAAVCIRADVQVRRLGESVLPEEAVYWAHRLREEDALDVNPGAAYADRELQDRLTTKILFWLGERRIPELSAERLTLLERAKTEMKTLLARCEEARARSGRETR